jgi:hypothetical protein
MKIFLSAIIIFIFTFASLYAQAPEMEWFKGQGTNTEEHVHEGKQTSDGGYIAIGHGIESSDADDMLIIKVDENGNFEWKQEFGISGRKGAGYCVDEVSGGYVVGGAIFNPDSQRTQRFLAKLDLPGNIVWEKFYGSSGIGGIRGIDITSDGFIIATGYMNTPNTSEFQGFVFIVDEGDGFLLKLDMDGNVEWEKSIEAPQGTKVRQIDQGYAVCSTVWTSSPQTDDHQDFCLIKTDQDGEKIWRKLYGGEYHDHLYDFDLSMDGSYILAGHTLSYGVKNWDYLLFKVDSAGTEEWHKTFGQPRGYDATYIHDEAYAVRQTPDGGFIIAGGSGDEYSYSESGHSAGPSDEWKAYLVRTDSSGNILWEGIYPPYSIGNNAAEYVDITTNEGFIVFVDTDTQIPPNPNNFGFLKTKGDPVTEIKNKRTITPEKFGLIRNYPNPFNPETNIDYSLAISGEVVLEVYDILGKKVKTLINQHQISGIYNLKFDASELPSGIYIVRLKQGLYSDLLKMVLIK